MTAKNRFKKVVPLARRFGAALVVGCIDDDKQQAQAVTPAGASWRWRSGRSSCSQKKYGVEPEDIIFDPLVFRSAPATKNYNRLRHRGPSKASV